MNLMSDDLFAMMALIGVVFLLAVGTRFFWRRLRAPAKPLHRVVVDGSNVMHWGGAPSEMVLIRVISELCRRGYSPLVIFDANVGYKLGYPRYLDDAAMARIIGLPARDVFVVAKGVVADEVILDLAQTHGWRVVSNDQFRDWRLRFPVIATKGARVQGTWRDGTVVWRNAALLRAPVPADAS